MAEQFSVQEYADMVIFFGEAGIGRGRAQRAAVLWEAEHGRPVDPRTIDTTVDRFRRTGSVLRRNPNGGRPRDQRDRFYDPVVQAFEADSSRSLRPVARLVSANLNARCTYSMAQRIMKEDGQHAYHYRRVQDLREGDPENRLAFAQLMLNEIEVHPGTIDQILWTDESMYTRTGMFNQHNEHQWDYENPFAVRPDGFQNRFSANIWVGLISNVRIGPVELPNPVNAQNYLHFLENDLPPLLEDQLPQELIDNIIFMHDGAPAHTAVIVRDYLDEVYGDNWIGNNGPIEWPARSPDLNPLDYFYFGDSKQVVYHNGAPENREQMLERIHHHAQHLEADKIERATHQIRRRAMLCIQEGGRHFEQCLKGDNGDEDGRNVENGMGGQGEQDDNDMDEDNDDYDDGDGDDDDDDDDDDDNDPDWEM